MSTLAQDRPQDRPQDGPRSERVKHQNIAQLYFGLFTEINIIAHLSTNELERVLPNGLSSAQFGVLNHFVRLGGEWGPARLARAFQVTKGAMTNTLQRLEAQGLVSIQPDPKDARGKLVAITQAGVEMRERCVGLAWVAMSSLVPEATPAEVEAAMPFLQKLRKIMDERRDAWS
jgi:DNA-binding MarR family transcriptional regulator